MKYTKSSFLIAIIVLGICTGFATIGKYKPLLLKLTENEVIKKLKEQFTSYSEKHSEDRVYLQFNQPFYKPGESIWFQAYVRNGEDMEASKSGILHIEFISPKGNKEREMQLILKNGVASGDIELSEEVAGGLYKIKAYTQWQQNDENPAFFEKDIQVQRVILPRLKMKLDFEKEAYSAGDKVEATLDLESLSNEPLKNHLFKFVASLKGQEFNKNAARTDSDGNAKLTFNLPEDLNTADGLLNILIQYNGQTESVSKAIPIVLNNISLEFFPEGGDMVAGLEGKVAFRALNEFGKPADVSGIIKDNEGNTVTKFSSFHQGMGAFDLSPAKGKTYTAHFTSPKSDKKIELPEPLPQGYSLAISEASKSGVKALIQATVNEELSLFAQVRGKVCYSNSFKVKKGENIDIEIDTKDFPVGVAQFTLFDSRGIARAERLSFVNQHKQLSVEVSTDKEQYKPREKVTLTVKVRDERGIPVPGNFSLAVADDKLISFADDKQGNILSKLLLEPDLKAPVYEPNFYFDSEEAKSEQALDYLLMTQGWRRFTWEKIEKEANAPLKFARQLAIIQGVVYGNNGLPASGATVSADKAGVEVKTDKEGKFYIKGIELYESETLTATDKDLSSNVFVSSYDESIVIHLRQVYRYKKTGAVLRDNAFGAGGGGDDWGGAEEPVFMERAEKEMAILEEKVDRKQNLKKDDAPMPVVDVKANKEANKKPMPKIEVVADEEEIADDFAFGAVADEDIWFGDEIVEKPLPNTPKYYRAREFSAPVYNTETPVETRTDFRSTIFWKGNVELDRTGKAVVEFYTSDAITAFRATAEGVAAGMVGRAESVFFTQLPFSMDVKVPLEVTMGDFVEVPVTLTNNTKKAFSGDLTFNTPGGWELGNKLTGSISIPAGQTITELVKFNILNKPESGEIKFTFTGENGMKDAFVQPVKIGAKGFPVSIALSGESMTGEHKFALANSVAGTMEAKLVAYPTSLSDMLAGIESILREPSGCFEQTSSSTYPNIMVLQYLKENDYDNTKVYARANNLIDKGYKKLVTFETKEKGYEWFGGAPGHEALTAYGLMEFADMKQVYGQVDESMIERTGNWLLSKKDGKGGFEKNPRALDSFGGADVNITNAYIVYSLSEAGYTKEIEKELNAAYEVALKEKDPYQMGLVANALYNTKDARADKFLAALNQLQDKDGHFEGKTHSITRSTGQGLKIETTALAVLANLKPAERAGGVIKPATQYIMQNRSAYGGYGNTQSTVMALKALTEFAKYAKRTAESGDLEVFVNGKKVGNAHFDKGQQGEIVIDGLEKYLADGSHKVEVKFKNCSKALPYTFSVNYSTQLPPSSKECSIGLTTNLAKSKVAVGETVRLTTKIQNLTTDGQPMTIAIIGLPGGLSAQPWQLKELQEQKAFDYYEVTESRVVFYYRQMLPSETRSISLDLKAEIAGQYEAAASTAYLYYTAEHKSWVAGEKVAVVE